VEAQASSLTEWVFLLPFAPSRVWGLLPLSVATSQRVVQSRV